ncbi:type II toxin-antitoxin system RelE family toxin [Mobiluncus mulieris]|nr:type II toxin-antitoxin system RelE/ParE family toxin [Mobiluncus mulieris]
MYSVIFTSAAARQIRKMDAAVRSRILKEIENLSGNPRPAGVKKLVGEPAWRIRVGDYRIIYEIEDSRLTVTVIRAAHRREVYTRR